MPVKEVNLPFLGDFELYLLVVRRYSRNMAVACVVFVWRHIK
jgi:hypothetical protein